MTELGTACFVGLCLLASCVHAQPLPCPMLDGSSRGQYCAALKKAAGSFVVDRDMFHVAPSFVRFEAAIRQNVQRVIARIDPFTDSLAALADSGLILNDELIDPASNYISFSILPLFEANTVEIDLPALTQSERRLRIQQLRKRLAKLNGALWSSAEIRKALAPLYTNLGLAPELLVLARNQAIQIIEGQRIASIILPADQVPARDIDRVLWNLVDTRHFRKTKGKRIIDFNRDLGYAEGGEPYAIQYQLQAMQLLISPLGYSVKTQPSTKTGAAQYVDLLVQRLTRKPRHIAGGFQYKPGQGFSALGTAQVSALGISGGGPSGALGSAGYSANYLGFSASANAGVTVERNRVLDGVKVNEQSTAEFATLAWQPWRALNGNTLTFQLVPSHALVLNQNLNTIEPGVQFLHTNFTSEYPWRALVQVRILLDGGFGDCIVTANTHRAFDHWEYDVAGRFENALGNAPIFELPSLGGADSVRGFRADDAIGRRLWSAQSELWRPIPRITPLKIAAFFDLGGAYQTTGSYDGLRAGVGLGPRLDFRVAVLKLDWGYGFGQAATGGSRGKFYFNVTIPTH
jgi:Omp85 superfamily domain